MVHWKNEIKQNVKDWLLREWETTNLGYSNWFAAGMNSEKLPFYYFVNSEHCLRIY